MSEDRYFAVDTADAFERERLEYLRQMCDPITVRRLEALGVRESGRCLEVGAGDGSVACWLAARVGPQGRGVATDINPRFLQGLAMPNLEVRHHHIVNDDLERAHYDLVHCRAMLMHLAQPMQALERMAAAVRPGGWLCIEEGDYGLCGTADPTHPAAERFTRALRAVVDAVYARGVMNPYFGRRVPTLVEGLGFVDVGHDGTAWVSRGQDAGARFHRLSLAVVRPAMIAAGVLTEEEYAVLEQVLEEPSFAFVSFVLFGAWGRRTS